MFVSGLNCLYFLECLKTRAVYLPVLCTSLQQYSLLVLYYDYGLLLEEGTIIHLVLL